MFLSYSFFFPGSLPSSTQWTQYSGQYSVNHFGYSDDDGEFWGYLVMLGGVSWLKLGLAHIGMYPESLSLPPAFFLLMNEWDPSMVHNNYHYELINIWGGNSTYIGDPSMMSPSREWSLNLNNTTVKLWQKVHEIQERLLQKSLKGRKY